MLFEALCHKTSCLLKVYETPVMAFSLRWSAQPGPVILLVRKQLLVSLDQTGLGACSVPVTGTGQPWRFLWLLEHTDAQSVCPGCQPRKGGRQCRWLSCYFILMFTLSKWFEGEECSGPQAGGRVLVGHFGLRLNGKCQWKLCPIFPLEQGILSTGNNS